jgi:S-layer homology domain.
MKIKTLPVRSIAGLLILVMLLTVYTGSMAFAQNVTVNPPKNYAVEDIGYNSNDEWYARLTWQHDGFPPDSREEMITVSFHEIQYGTGKRLSNRIQMQLPGNQTSLTVSDTYDEETNPNALKPGTIYESNLTASCQITGQSGRVSSQRSNTIKFLTGVRVEAKLVPGTNNIKIIWDDVWDTDGRIDYEIQISDVSGDSIGGISHTERIIGSKIGEAGAPPVTVNATEKKLEFTYTGAHPGRVYSVKVIPIPGDDVMVTPSEELPVREIPTSILIRTSRIGYTADGDTIWLLSWDPIILDEDVFKVKRIDYILYRYSGKNDDSPVQYILPDTTSYRIIISKDDKTTYSFAVAAYARSADSSKGDIYFASGERVELKETVPEVPEAPEIVDSFPEADLYYDDLVTSNSATVMWKVPYNGEGIGDEYIDTDIVYDIYLVDDIRYVENPPEEYRIASDISMGGANEIISKTPTPGRRIIGYRYDLTGLRSQSVYYFVIRAKKYYLVDERKEGLVVTTPKAYVSKSSVKVIITRPDTGTDRVPEAPSAPPFGVDRDSITTNSATLYLKKSWEAFYKDNRWYDISLFDGTDEEYEQLETKTINYEAGWKIVPHMIRYQYAVELMGSRSISYSDLKGVLGNFAMIQDGITIPDISSTDDQTIRFGITGLMENTSYIVWVTIENNDGVSSDPSDPIIINTKPPEVINPVTPTSPEDLYGIVGDDFVDLFWTVVSGMDYEIRCGTEENLDKANIKKTVTYPELMSSSYYRLSGLKPDTQYYIWIKAINPSTGKESAFSNPLIIKTEPYSPPPPPSGFGVSTDPDGVTESSITYVWTYVPGYTYILEFADNSSFNNAQRFETEGDFYTVTSLISNKRYYARLYARDNVTTLVSEPTRTIMVITNKSRNDYDSGYDLDDIPTGDVLVISTKVTDGIWTATSTGVNAYRMAEQIRAAQSHTVKIDMSRPPATGLKTVRLELGAVIFDTLSELKKDLYIQLPSNDLVIRPQTLQTDEYFKMKARDSNFTLRIDIVSPAAGYTLPSYLSLVAPITEVKIGPASSGFSFTSLVRPIKVCFPVDGITGYMAGEIGTYLYDSSRRAWTELDTKTDYSAGLVSGELTKPGAVAAATRNVMPSGSVSRDVAESLKAIQAVYRLRSIEGKSFRYTDSMKQTDIVKLLLDLTGTAYDDNTFITQAVRSGILGSSKEIGTGYARRDQAISLLVSYYRFRTKLPAKPENSPAWSYYRDLNKVSSGYLDAVKFAIENGVVKDDAAGYLNPDKTITYGEFFIMLERLLKICGDL